MPSWMAGGLPPPRANACPSHSPAPCAEQGMPHDSHPAAADAAAEAAADAAAAATAVAAATAAGVAFG